MMSERTCATCKAGYFDNPITGMMGECRLQPNPVTIKPNYWCLEWLSKGAKTKVEQAADRLVKRGTVYPKDFEPNARAQALAEGYGLNLAKTVAEMRDHAETHGRVCRDWQAALRMWMKKTVEFQEKRR